MLLLFRVKLIQFFYPKVMSSTLGCMRMLQLTDSQYSCGVPVKQAMYSDAIIAIQKYPQYHKDIIKKSTSTHKLGTVGRLLLF